jgi:hypothetical protein
MAVQGWNAESVEVRKQLRWLGRGAMLAEARWRTLTLTIDSRIRGDSMILDGDSLCFNSIHSELEESKYKGVEIMTEQNWMEGSS